MYLGTALQALSGGLHDWEQQRSTQELKALQLAELNEYRMGRLEQARQFNVSRGDNMKAITALRGDQEQDRQAGVLEKQFPGMAGDFRGMLHAPPVDQTNITRTDTPALGALAGQEQTTTQIPAIQALSQGYGNAIRAQRTTGDPQSFQLGESSFSVPGKEFSPNQENALTFEQRLQLAKAGAGARVDASDAMDQRRQKAARLRERNQLYNYYTHDRLDPSDPAGYRRQPGDAPDVALRKVNAHMRAMYPENADEFQDAAGATPPTFSDAVNAAGGGAPMLGGFSGAATGAAPGGAPPQPQPQTVPPKVQARYNELRAKGIDPKTAHAQALAGQ